MKQLLFALSIVLTINTFSQTATAPSNKDSIIQDQKFYFPTIYYTDSTALGKMMPKLAGQMLNVYHEENKRTYFENTIPYYLQSKNYQKAIDMVDSIQKIDDDPSYNIEIKSYAVAKMAEKKQARSFDDFFKEEFTDEFNHLSFSKKVAVALIDSASVNDIGKGYALLKEKLKKAGKDSLNLEDSRSLCEKFTFTEVYNKIYPLMIACISPGYKQMFPAIKNAKWGGVVPVQDIDEVPDPSMQYKLLVELTDFSYKGEDSAATKEANDGLQEVARKINLHEAAGIPRKNISMVVVAHGSVLNALLTNEKYKKKYGIDNPNIPLIKELQDYGVKIIVCGQAMTFFHLEMKDLVPGIKQAFSAQIVLSSYQLAGYVFYDVRLK